MNLKFRHQEEVNAPGLRSAPVLDQPRNTNYPRNFKQPAKTRAFWGSLSPIAVSIFTYILLPVAAHYAGETTHPGAPKLAQIVLIVGMVTSGLLTLLYLTMEKSFFRQRLNSAGILLATLLWTLCGAVWFFAQETESTPYSPPSRDRVLSLEVYAWAWTIPLYLGIALYVFAMLRRKIGDPLDEL